jgi:arylsulfatase A
VVRLRSTLTAPYRREIRNFDILFSTLKTQSMNVLRLLCFIVLSFAFGTVGTVQAAADKPPNIVFFLVDDLGWADMECYGNTFHETPNVNRLAKQGMRFTDAYAACPVCSPTRASIMTGKYPATLNLTDFIPGHWRPWAKLVVPKMNLELPHREVTFAEALKKAGYVSGSFGKWHLGGPTHNPDSQGLDEFIVTGGRHFAPNFRTTPKTEVKKNEYLGDFLTRTAEGFMEKHREKPFVLYLSHYAVHIPLEAKQKLIEKYEKKPKPSRGVNNPIYAADLAPLTESIRRV